MEKHTALRPPARHMKSPEDLEGGSAVEHTCKSPADALCLAIGKGRRFLPWGASRARRSRPP